MVAKYSLAKSFSEKAFVLFIALVRAALLAFASLSLFILSTQMLMDFVLVRKLSVCDLTRVVLVVFSSLSIKSSKLNSVSLAIVLVVAG